MINGGEEPDNDAFEDDLIDTFEYAVEDVVEDLKMKMMVKLRGEVVG
jgi:hypothetical protein